MSIDAGYINVTEDTLARVKKFTGVESTPEAIAKALKVYVALNQKQEMIDRMRANKGIIDGLGAPTIEYPEALAARA